MKYFKFNLHTDDFPDDFVVFSIDFVIEGEERIWEDELHNRYMQGKPMAYLRVLDDNGNPVAYTDVASSGRLPEFSFTGTQAIIVRADVLEHQDIKDFAGLSTIPVLLEGTNIIYHVLWFDEFVDCVDWEHSEYVPWEEGAVLQPWDNPRARWFLSAVLDAKKLPANLDAFKLKDWSAAFNFVVNERVKQKFLSMPNAKQLLNFIELPVF